jgi:hypothetical protein
VRRLAEDTREVEYDTGPELLQTEASEASFCAKHLKSLTVSAISSSVARSCLRFLFGLCLAPETTQQEAEALAEHITSIAPRCTECFMIAAWPNESL